MSKFELNVRHRPTMAETIEQRFACFLATLRDLPPPWGLAEGKELRLPPVGTGLSASAQLRGKLGTGIAGIVTISYRAPANVRDQASHDDSIAIEFDTSKVVWRQLVDDGLPGYISAIGAYIGHLYRWDESPEEWRLLKEVANKTGKDLDGRDGFFRFGPVSFMDRELCRRGCNGLMPEQIVTQLRDVVPDVKMLGDGVLIVATDHFPEQHEIVAADRLIRERLGLPIWA